MKLGYVMTVTGAALLTIALVRTGGWIGYTLAIANLIFVMFTLWLLSRLRKERQ